MRLRHLTLVALATGCDGPGLTPPDAAALDAERPSAPDYARLPPVPPGVRTYGDAETSVDPDAQPQGASEADRACFSGGATGIACTPDGSPLAEARIAAQTRDCQGMPVTVETTSAADGTFVLRALAPGPTRIVVESGRFLAEATVDVPPEGTAFVGGGSGKVCFESLATRIAVLSGQYDHAEHILETMGFEHDLLCGEPGHAVSASRLLQDWARLSTYQLLVVNCGSGVTLRSGDRYTQAAITNLRRFVRGGGSVYVSDLSSDFVDVVWPGVVTFAPHGSITAGPDAPACCVCGVDCPEDCPLPEDVLACDVLRPPLLDCRGWARQSSGAGDTGNANATLDAPFLRRALGVDVANLVFDGGGWMQIASVAPGVEVLVSGVSPGEREARPMMVLFRPEPGGGQVAYTSFHTSAQAGETIDALIRALLLRL